MSTAVDEHNAAIEAQQIERLKTATDDRLFLYMKDNTPGHAPTNPSMWVVTTWPGTIVSSGPVWVGRRVKVGGIAGPHAYKRSVDCVIYGVRYVGWFYESAGDYCRLRKSTRQPKVVR